MENRIMSIAEAFSMFRDVWNLYKTYAGRWLDDAERDNFRDDARRIYEKYQTPFAKELLLAVINNEIDRTLKILEKRKEIEKNGWKYETDKSVN